MGAIAGVDTDLTGVAGDVTAADAGTLRRMVGLTSNVPIWGRFVGALQPGRKFDGILDGPAVGRHTLLGSALALSLAFPALAQLGPGPGASVATQSLLFCTGADGDVTITGAITLTRDMCYRNLTISGAGALNTAGWRVFVAQTLDVSGAGAGAIAANGFAGNNASNATGGAVSASVSGNATTMFWNYAAGAVGGTGTTGVGGNGGGSVTVNSIGGNTPSGGGGGLGVSAGGNGGSSGNSVNAGALFPIPDVSGHWYFGTGGRVLASMQGAGGGAGGGDGTNAGGGGGGGGYGAGPILIAARAIQRGTNTTASIIQSKGGHGGNGATPAAGNTGGGGGGAAGSGGFVYIICESLLGSQIANAVDVSGGDAGNGGNGHGTGLGGAAPAGSNGGGYQLLRLSPASFSAVLIGNGVVGSAATAPSGTTGGIGGLGAVARGAL